MNDSLPDEGPSREADAKRRRQLVKYVTPAILTNVCTFLFSVIDGVFVGQGCGTMALGAVNLALPFVLVANALNMLVSIGGCTIVAVRFGRGDVEGARSAFMHSLTAILVVGLLVTLVGTVFTGQAAELLGAQGGFVELTKEYVFWWALFAVPTSLNINLLSFCRNDGEPGLVAKATVAGTVCNVFLDWLMVFPLGWGLMGAAVATGLSQALSMLIIATHFLFKRGRLTIRRFKLDLKTYRLMLLRGLPEAIAQFSTPITTLCLNYVLFAGYGDIGVNAYSVMNYIGSFTLAVFFGASEGLQPLFGLSYGACEDDDLRFYYKAGIAISLAGSTLCFAAYLVFSEALCGIFGADVQTTAFTVEHLWQYAWAFIPGSVNTLLSAYLYSTERSKPAILLNVIRSFLFNTACILLLPMTFGPSIIWFTFGIYEVLVMFCGIGIQRYTERNGIQYRREDVR